MCGIFAFVGGPGDVSTRSAAVIAANKRMLLRGPDAEGVWNGSEASLGHRRLAIIDLDQRSHQPMRSSCGRYSIVFNGEVYNYDDLRKELRAAGEEFRTHSDTEVILRLFVRDGERMLPRLRGMFAFAIWDEGAHRLFVARDPYGIKPLYYAETSGGVLVGSQVKALLQTGLVSQEPDPVGQAGFWLTGSVPEPHTWYRGIRALPAGHFAWIASGVSVEPRQWWDIRDDWRRCAGAEMPDGEVKQHVRAALVSSVRAHLVSDVPIGIFLSGGIDSGALAGLICEQEHQLQAVTIAFREFARKREDESVLASAVAAHYGFNLHVRVVSREEFIADLPRIFDAMDQPSIDGVNSWFASKAAAELGLKVVVSGVGGDELFQGYEHFDSLPRLVDAWSRLSCLPGAMGLAELACSVHSNRSGNPRWRFVPQWARTLPGGWLARRGLFAPSELSSLMGAELAEEALKEMEPLGWIQAQAGELPRDERLAVSLMESSLYLRNQLLRDSDWASMAHSVELRTPFVDAWLLRDLSSVACAFRRFPKKRLLAQSLKKPLPPAVTRRRKSGFVTPVEEWLAAAGASNGHGLQGWARMVSGGTGIEARASESCG